MTFRSLGIRNYRLYFFGQLTSVSGTWMQTVALGWLILSLTGSAFDLGIVTSLQFLPMLLFGMWGGVLADRFDKRRLLIWSESALATVAAIFAVLTSTGGIRLWTVFLLAFVEGCIFVVDTPADQAFLLEIVGRDNVPNAVGLNSAMFQGARVAGPAVAGLLIATVGIAACFFVNALTYAVSLVTLMAVRHSDLEHQDRLSRTGGQVRAALGYVWTMPPLRLLVLLVAVVGTFGFNFTVVLPLLAKEAFHGGGGAYGLMTAAMGLGALFGALVVASRARPSHPLLLGSGLAFGAATIVTAAAPGLAWALPVLVVMGGSAIGFFATANATMQTASESLMRGRVMALFGLVVLGTTPIGGPLIGLISEWAGIRVGLGFGGAVTLVAIIVFAAAAAPVPTAGGPLA